MTRGADEVASDDTKGKLTGRKVLLIALGMFLVVGGVNAYFVYAALDSWTGVTTEDAYREGLRYNDVLERRAAQERTGWQGRLDLTGAGNAAVLLVRITDSNGEAVDGAEVTAELRRPTDEKLDRTARLISLGDGRYQADVQIPAQGLWDVHVEAVRGEDYFEMRDRVTWR